VLYKDAELPPFLANRLWVDFRAATTGPAYEAALDELICYLKGKPSRDRPDRHSFRAWPQSPTGESFRPGGALEATLAISPSEVSLQVGITETTARPRGLAERG
jgi:hypothetical protein